MSHEAFGYIVAIGPNGRDGKRFPITNNEVVFGRFVCLYRIWCGVNEQYRSSTCDVRIQAFTVSKRHTRLSVDENRKIWLENLSTASTTDLNGRSITEKSLVHDNNVFLIGHRQFRVEYG